MLIFISSFLIEHEVRNNLVFFKVVEQSSGISKQTRSWVSALIPLLSVPDEWNIMVCMIAYQVRESVFYIHKDGWSMWVVTSNFFWNVAVIYFIKYFFEVKFEWKDPPETWSCLNDALSLFQRSIWVVYNNEFNTELFYLKIFILSDLCLFQDPEIAFHVDFLGVKSKIAIAKSLWVPIKSVLKAISGTRKRHICNYIFEFESQSNK